MGAIHMLHARHLRYLLSDRHIGDPIVQTSGRRANGRMHQAFVSPGLKQAGAEIFQILLRIGSHATRSCEHLRR